jgi:hypothetical protein
MAIERFLDGPRYRILPLALFLDGVPQYCDDGAGSYPYDICAHQGLVREERQIEEETEKYRARCVEEDGIGLQAGEARDAGGERLRAYRIE